MRQPTNREIKWALRTHMPSLDWRFVRVPMGEPKGAWRVFSAKREGIKYTVQVLSWWPLTQSTDRTSEYAFFVDGVCVLSLKGVDHLHWAARCAVTIGKLVRAAYDRAGKLQDALERGT